MTAWTERLAAAAGDVAAFTRGSSRAVRRRLRRRGQPRIVAYHGHGTERVLHLRGRVLENLPLGTVAAEDRPMRNLANTLRRAFPTPVPHALVRIQAAGTEWEHKADDEGFFSVELQLPDPLDDPPRWYPVELELLAPPPASPVLTMAEVLIPPASARLAVISDIDDTVVRTDVTNWLRMARTVLLTNAHSRLPFTHVDSLYRALRGGPSGEEHNPIFYVSSSPWNFHDLLEQFMDLHGVPRGPLFLRDWDISARRLFGLVDHGSHKLSLIRALLDTHADLPFVLIGDSGQQDPEIYREVVREYPGRISAIYIRDVTTEQRDLEVRAVAEEVREMGSWMLPVAETAEAARDAAARGLISKEALREMVEEELEQPTPAAAET